MHSFAATLITGAIAFVATNVDDIVILTLFFSRTRQRWPIIAGQYLGFSVLIAISLAGFFGGLILPHHWVRLLGLVPVAVGIKKLFVTRDDHVGWNRVGVFEVALVTFTSGADNIGIYAPLFAVSDSAQLIELLMVFYLLLGMWCVLGYVIPRHQTVANVLRRCGHWIGPFVLIGLGVYILSN